MSDIDEAREAMQGNWYVVDAKGACLSYPSLKHAEAKSAEMDRDYQYDAPHIVCQLAPVGAPPKYQSVGEKLVPVDADSDERMVWEAAVAALQGMGCWCPNSEEGYAVSSDNHDAVFALKARWAMNQARALLAAFKDSQP